MIALENIAFGYPGSDFRLGLEALSIGRGQAAAIIGPSGCGKTTLLHLVAGIVPAQGGAITVDGVPVHALGERERRHFRIANIGLVFQDFALLDYLDFFDNILHPYRINPALTLTREVKQRARSLAERMGHR